MVVRLIVDGSIDDRSCSWFLSAIAWSPITYGRHVSTEMAIEVEFGERLSPKYVSVAYIHIAYLHSHESVLPFCSSSV